MMDMLEVYLELTFFELSGLLLLLQSQPCHEEDMVSAAWMHGEHALFAEVAWSCSA